ncbi:ArpU family phage packaging/lysis transcriptional regulator [Enterococcus dongliensis]|uniref:ArpU family phage packaging/lysis transcriptional regulator n=1 Tax=Enterococcus dongliensis TaxID=2559925 RepID=UPI00288F8FD9|nr:ArpU family phage packaging/lysis transcriptional regulator [Enterococcus dongliensis]MDT2641776.1 ArpU family phage packaging/lysis transcriptional regulator [Enterococcus dongliensis]
MDLTRPLDEKQTKSNTRKILRMYRQLERQAGKRITLAGQKINDMPKGQFKPDGLENQIIRRLDAERECLEILEAVERLEDREKKIIQLTYLLATQCTNYKIGQELKYSERSIERFKSRALIQFAYAYKNGELLVWK